MKLNEVKDTGHSRIANLSAILLVIFIGVNAFLEAMQQQEGASVEGLIGFGMVIALVLLIPIYRSTRDFTKLAFYTPFIVLVFNTLIMIWSGWNSYYLIVCLCALGISCLYSNFLLTVIFAAVQTAAVGVLIVFHFPVIGANVSAGNLAGSCIAFMFSSVMMLLLDRSATVSLGKALYDGNSFRTFLTTTANYLAMVDKSNKVIYVSKPLSDLAGIEDPELGTGRSLIDLFPIRELKLLASKMLGQRGFFEADWEFVLDGQKRYFKAASRTLTGAKGTLINLQDLTYLAERDEIAAMRDSLKIGLFFMNKDYIIQDNYSRHLEELLLDSNLTGKCFLDILAASVSAKDLESIKDYFDMVLNRSFDQVMLDEINPLQELHYVCAATWSIKIFQCEFIPVERGKGEVFVLVTIYDITAKVELQQRLLEKENRRQEEMRSIFELIHVDPTVFNDFMEDAEYEFSRIDDTLKDDSLSSHDALVEVYQAVHAIKSNAVILGLNTFGEKVHDMESKIKKLREQKEEVTFDEMLHLTVELEKLSNEKDEFKFIIERINTFKGNDVAGPKQNEYVLVESLTKAVHKAADTLGKKAKLVISGIDIAAIEKGPRRLMKEVLMQLVRNAVVHGIEMPEERIARGKNETGIIRLLIKSDGGLLQIKLADDGGGLDFKKIREKAYSQNMITRENANDRNVLLQTIFSPGFSTAETDGVHAGRGIGLNLVRDRVRSAKGTIKLQTESGKGTVFSIILPMENNTANENNA